MILGALRRTHAILLLSLLISGLAGSLQAEILSFRAFPCVEPDPAIAGTLDWVRFRPGAKVGEDWDVDDSRSGGAGIQWIAGQSRIRGDSRLSIEFVPVKEYPCLDACYDCAPVNQAVAKRSSWKRRG